MRKGCRLARTLFPFMLCLFLVAESSPSAAYSKGRESNVRAEVNGASDLPNSEDANDSLENPDYCTDQATDTREPNYNYDPNTLNNRHIRVKRVAMNEDAPDLSGSVKKRSLGEFKDKLGYSGVSESEPLALALSNQESAKYADTIETSRLNGDYVEKYAEQDPSGIYDDLEAKDIVKRGVLLGGEYEEVNEDDDLSDNLSEDGNADSRSESRAKRDPSHWEESKGEDSSDPESKETSKVDGELARIDESKSLDSAGEADLVEKPRNLLENGRHSKRSAGFNDQTGLEGDADPKSLKDAKLYEAELRETRGESERRRDDSKRNVDSYGDYEKRAELEIQRKIEAIKADIKREIEHNQRLREIEENNAKFDQLRLEDNADEDPSEDAKVQKRQTAKRTVAQHSKRIVRNHDAAKLDKRSLGKKERKRETVRRKVKSRKPVVRKGSGSRKSARKGRISKVPAAPVKKREYVRQVILVKNAADTRKRKRTPDTLRGNAEASVDGPMSAAVEALGRAANENEQRLAPDYNEAFGGLQADPRASLTRYKRIKRVLSVPT